MSDNLVIPDECLIKDVKIHFDRLIGAGSYGLVYVATYYGTKVAAKKLHAIFFDGVSPEENRGILKSWLNELKLMNSLRHPNIVQFYGVFNPDDSSSLLLTGSSYIISELLAKSLQARNLDKPRLTIRQIIDIAMDIAAGLCYLHNRQDPIMHRDLASKNVLLSMSGQAKIADLGVAKFTAQVQQSHTRHPGTDYYMPLETVVPDDSYDHSIDVYALGVIILEIAIGKDPTATQNLKKVGNHFEIVPETERRRNDFYELQNSPNVVLKNVIMLCLSEKEERVSANIVTMHLEKLKNSEIYELCDPSPIFKINQGKQITENISLEHHHDFKEIQNQNESLKNEMQMMNKKLKESQKENEDLKNQLQNLQQKIKKLEQSNNELEKKFEKQKSELKGDVTALERTHQSLPQKQPMTQCVPSVSSLLSPHQMHHSVVVMPKYQTSTSTLADHPLNPSPVYGTVPKQPQLINYGPDPPRSLSYQQRIPIQSHDTIGSPTYNYNNPLDRDFMSLPANLSTCIPPGVKEAIEYLNYQLSCMERIMQQLKSVNSSTSDNLVSSYMETLKEQIIKTAEYIRRLPFHMPHQQLVVTIQRIDQAIGGAHFDKIYPKYSEVLRMAARNLHDAALKYTSYS